MELKTNILITDELLTKVNSVAIDITKTISSQAPRSVPTEIVRNNLVKVQSIGSEIGINNLPTSAQQLKHKVIKICVECKKIELTFKYHLKTTLEKYSRVLCRVCCQNTEEEYIRRSSLQLERMKDSEYKKNAISALIGPLDAYEEKVKEFCESHGMDTKTFRGFRRELGSRYDYPLEFNNHLRFKIKRRDSFNCQMCFKPEKELSFSLEIHHIDFSKHNNIPQNLVALCKKCHSSIKYAKQEENIKLKIYAELHGNMQK